jgi:hypothetical protein
MTETESDLTIKICQNLPFNLTLFEKDGFCQKGNPQCDYNRTNFESIPNHCTKKTYNPLTQTHSFPLSDSLILR